MRYFQDPTVPDRETRKRVYFWEDKQKHINFAARVQLDGLKQGQFFRAIIYVHIWMNTKSGGPFRAKESERRLKE